MNRDGCDGSKIHYSRNSEFPFIKQRSKFPEVQVSYQLHVTQGQKTDRNHRCRNQYCPLLRPSIKMQIIVGPLHTQPQTNQPPQLPGPQIECTHLVQWHAQPECMGQPVVNDVLETK